MGLCSSSTAARAASDPGAAAAGDAAAAAAAKKGRGIVACGKRTDFGYDKDFEARYSLGKLLGHGQFGYTFAATDRGSGDRVAVKRIDKAKVSCRLPLPPPSRRAVSVSPRSSSLEVAIPSVPLVHRTTVLCASLRWVHFERDFVQFIRGN